MCMCVGNGVLVCMRSGSVECRKGAMACSNRAVCSVTDTPTSSAKSMDRMALSDGELRPELLAMHNARHALGGSNLHSHC
jgi:hypothetical protein